MVGVKNILFITADELRSDAVGFMGNPDVKTPCLDALAQRGTVCEQHFAPFPKCVPSRIAMHTGRATHTDGLRTVMSPNHLPKGDPNLGEFLRTQGYETAVLGLNHVWEDSWFYGDGDQKNKKSGGAVDYTSFTEGRMAALACMERNLGDGCSASGPHIDALAEIDYQGVATGKSTYFSDENRADQAIAYLEEIRDPTKPFFLQLNISKPHPPYGIHEPYYSMYDRQAITPWPYDLPENAPQALRAQREYRLGFDIPEDSLRELQAVYYGMVSFVDAQIGRVINALDALDLADDTLIIFTADHGDYAGQYGLNEKWDASLQECLLKVPFIIAGKGIEAGTRYSGLSEHVDLPATIFEYLGLERPEDWIWHGSSMLTLLNGRDTRHYVFADGGHEKAMRDRFCTPAWDEKDGKRSKATGGKQLTYQECPDAMMRCKMVRDNNWKYIVRENGDNELYHIAEDPHEMKNLIDDPVHTKRIMTMQQELLFWCLRTDTDRPFLATFGA